MIRHSSIHRFDGGYSREPRFSTAHTTSQGLPDLLRTLFQCHEVPLCVRQGVDDVLGSVRRNEHRIVWVGYSEAPCAAP